MTGIAPELVGIAPLKLFGITPPEFVGVVPQKLVGTAPVLTRIAPEFVEAMKGIREL